MDVKGVISLRVLRDWVDGAEQRARDQHCVVGTLPIPYHADLSSQLILYLYASVAVLIFARLSVLHLESVW